MAWIERVPSQSNPADELSRKKIYEYAGIQIKQIDLLERWKACTTEQYANLSPM